MINYYTINTGLRSGTITLNETIIGTVGDDMQEVSQMVRDTIANLFSS